MQQRGLDLTPEANMQRLKTMRSFVVLAVFGYALAASLSGCATPKDLSGMAWPPVDPVREHALRIKGDELRDAIDSRYDKRFETNPPSSKNGFSITDTVTQYIPIGTSFADAVVILKAAGFDIEPPFRKPTSLRHEMILFSMTHPGGWFSMTRFSIALTPVSDDDWSSVSDVSAGIWFTYF